MTIQRSWANRTAIGILLRRMQVRALSSAPIRRRVFLALFRCGESGPRVTMAWGAAEPIRIPAMLAILNRKVSVHSRWSPGNAISANHRRLTYPQPLNDHHNQNYSHANGRPQSDFLHPFVIHHGS